MDERWDNFIHRNSRGRYYTQDCQLVTAVNAYYHLYGRTLKQKGEKYRSMAEDCGCKAGACINIKRAWVELGIWPDKIFTSFFDLKDELDQLEGDPFFEITINGKWYGYHSCAIADYIPRAECCRIINLKYLTSTMGWIFWEDLKLYLRNDPDKNKVGGMAWSFKKLDPEFREWAKSLDKKEFYQKV